MAVHRFHRLDHVEVEQPQRAGMASGINSTFRQVGIATGIAGLGGTPGGLSSATTHVGGIAGPSYLLVVSENGEIDKLDADFAAYAVRSTRTGDKCQ